MTEFNLEAGMPTAVDAIRRLTSILSTQRALRTRVIKLIHGYGSSGKGGKSARRSAATSTTAAKRARSNSTSAAKSSRFLRKARER